MCRAGFALMESRSESLAGIMSSALHSDSRSSYVIPDEQSRRAVLLWLFRSVEVHTSSGFAGGAVWVHPGETARSREWLYSKIAGAPFKLESTSLRRALRLLSRMDSVRRRLVPGPHWYLLAHAGQSALVLKPMLLRADADGLPCYVEVFDERTLPLYISLGFRFHGAGRVPGGGPNFWAMLRPPQKQTEM